MTQPAPALAWTTVGPLALLVLGELGCKPAPTAAPPAPEQSAPAAAADSTTPPKLEVCSGELQPAADGLVDDFEDGDNQVAALAGRGGTWWSAKDALGSVFTHPTGSLLPSEGGADSAKAMHVSGKTVTGSNDAWGIEIGANFINARGGLYDASKYAGLRFKAKATGPTQTVRVNLGDVNTHADTGVCTTCWNHFRKDFPLHETWQTYTMRFADLTQRDGWGAPRPANLFASKLVTVSFALDGGKEFDVWIDDIEFLVCAP